MLKIEDIELLTHRPTKPAGSLELVDESLATKEAKAMSAGRHRLFEDDDVNDGTLETIDYDSDDKAMQRRVEVRDAMYDIIEAKTGTTHKAGLKDRVTAKLRDLLGQTREYFIDSEQGSRRKKVAAAIGGVAAAAAVGFLAYKFNYTPSGQASATVPPAAPRLPGSLVPSGAGAHHDGTLRAATPLKKAIISPPSLKLPSLKLPVSEKISPATYVPRQAPPGIQLSTDGTMWSAMHKAGFADENIISKLTQAANASKLPYEWDSIGTDKYLEFTRPDGSKFSDTKSIVRAIGAYLTR